MNAEKQRVLAVRKLCASALSLVLFLCGFACLPASQAFGQEYPSKPIRIVVPNSPGLSQDIAARIMAPEMSKLLGQPVIVENKPGANQMIGLEYVARQMPADGYTMTIVPIGHLASLPLIAKELRFDTLKELPPVMGIFETRLAFVIPSPRPWKSLNDMADYAKANPGKLNYGTATPILTLLTVSLLRDLGVSAVNIPFSGGGPMVTALFAGNIDMAMVGAPQAVSGGDKLRALAQTGDKRSETLPDTPTFVELGFPDIQSALNSLNVRVGTPKAITDKLFTVVSSVLQDPAVRTAITKSQLEVTVRSQDEAAMTLANDARKFALAAKAIGLQPQ